VSVESFPKTGDAQFKTGWIYDRIIDAFLYRLCEVHPHLLYAETVVTLALMNGSILDRLWIGEDMNGKSVVFFPCNLAGNHWVLFIADVINKTITYWNPTGMNPSKKECQIFSLIGDLMANKLQITVDTWNRSVPNHTLQSDSYNCGVFIM